jgi:phosphatidate cytidylyltransferase
VLLDQYLAPWHPILFAMVLVTGIVACSELHNLIEPARRPLYWLVTPSVMAVLLVNWLPHLPGVHLPAVGPWHWIPGGFAAVVIVAFLVEMAGFRAPGESVSRVALTVWMTAYLGLLPSYFLQLRWIFQDVGSQRVDYVGTTALFLAVFVPKGCDIGAYMIGRFFGRHRMVPVLSPRKTWEGAVGGVCAAVAVALLINRLSPAPPLPRNWLIEVGFGATVGILGMMGDLAESLIKRDLKHKDASQNVPGFGGLLDVIDAVIFAAPLAYLWFFVTRYL